LETTVKYRKGRLFGIALILVALLALGIAVYAMTHGALSYANLNNNGGNGGSNNNLNVPPNNSTVISYVTVNHTYISTLTGKNETYTAIESYTATVTSTAVSTATQTSIVTSRVVQNNTVFVIETTTVTTTVTRNVTRSSTLPGPPP